MMLFIVILNVFFVWVLPVKSAHYETFQSKEVRLMNDGNSLTTPIFGTFVSVEQVDYLYEAVSLALQYGYKTIDVWDLYEDIVGKAIRDAISCGTVTREEVSVIIKLPLVFYKGKQVVRAMQQILKIMQLEYVDMVIFTPINTFNRKKYDILDIWSGLEEAKRLNLTLSIGVRYFDQEYFNMLLPYCTTVPAVNQIEVNPTFTNEELVDYCQRQGIIVTSYAPAGYTVPRPGVKNPPPPCLEDPVLQEIADKYCVSTIQVVLRHGIALGTVPMPRSVDEKNIKSNKDILDFSLTDKEVQNISQFNVDRPVYCIDAQFLYEMYTERLELALQRNKKLYQSFTI